VTLRTGDASQDAAAKEESAQGSATGSTVSNVSKITDSKETDPELAKRGIAAGDDAIFGYFLRPEHVYEIIDPEDEKKGYIKVKEDGADEEEAVVINLGANARIVAAPVDEPLDGAGYLVVDPQEAANASRASTTAASTSNTRPMAAKGPAKTAPGVPHSPVLKPPQLKPVKSSSTLAPKEDEQEKKDELKAVVLKSVKPAEPKAVEENTSVLPVVALKPTPRRGLSGRRARIDELEGERVGFAFVCIIPCTHPV
jgi:microcompartment protein CcmK/EutM